MLMHTATANMTSTTSANPSNNSSSQFSAEAHPLAYAQPVYNNNNVGEQQLQEKMTIDHLLQLMSQVSVSIKAGDFSTQLADNIFVLCHQLKTFGQQMEQTHKNDLNRIFVSLRQACCRDNGQLGTPCRLKMMELVELRAMGWRPNYSHTQYYLNRPEQSGPKLAQSTSNPIQQQFPLCTTNSFKAPLVQSINYCVPPPAPPPQSPYVFMPAEAQPQQQAGYFLIPATGGWPNQMVPMTNSFMPPSPHMSRSAVVAPLEDWQGRQQMAAYFQNTGMFGKQQTPNSPLLGARHLLDTSNISTKSNKCPQLREELTIRNCDSGKIMGVKGRRVALVEELSKTVISFQKVETKSKDRVLTITGTNQESIQQAKLLIEETIRRNVSPNRVGSDAEVTAVDDEQEEEDPGISIETSKDGTLKLCCADPEVLQAAQAALSDYLNRAHRGSRMSAEERELRKERRKSMPLQQTNSNSNKAGLNETPEMEKPIQETRRKLTGSTPNLMADENSPEKPTKTLVEIGPAKIENASGQNGMRRKVYDRTLMLALCPQDIGMDKLASIKETMPEIVRDSE